MKAFRFVFLAAVVALAMAAFAQDAPPQGPGGPGRGPHMDPEQHMARLTKELNLTEDQQAKIKPLVQAQYDEMKKLMEDTSIPREEKMPKMMEIRKSTNEKIGALLTPEQKKKFEEMNQRRPRRGPGGPGGPGGQPATPLS